MSCSTPRHPSFSTRELPRDCRPVERTKSVGTRFRVFWNIVGTLGMARVSKSLRISVYAGVPNGIRTRVAAVKGRCPRPLDDGDVRSHMRLICFVACALHLRRLRGLT